MKVQLRRWVTIGLMSGTLALSAVAGSAAVGASPASEARDDSLFLVGRTAPVDATAVTVVSAPLWAPAINQVFNDDDRR